MCMKFEVGKRYMNKPNDDIPSFFVGYSKEGHPVFQDEIQRATICNPDSSRAMRDWLNGLKEYKEPVVYTRYIHWFKRPDGEIEVTNSKEYTPPNCRPWKWEYIKTETVTHVEG